MNLKTYPPLLYVNVKTIRKQNLIILLVKKFLLAVSTNQSKDETNDAVHFLPLGQLISIESIRE